MDSKLVSAFKFHMRDSRPAFYYAEGYNGRNAWPEKAHGIAREALEAIARHAGIVRPYIHQAHA